MAQTENDVLLQMTDVTKTFPGVVALDKMCLTVRRGTVHALMGENGAGKSTLMKILSGLYKRDSGEIIFDGEPFNPSNIQEVLQRGISMIYQELNPVEAMTVAENIFCGREQRKAKGLYLDKRKMNRQAKELLDALDIKAIDPKDKVQFLSVAQKQLLEMAKAFSNNSKLIILDEPTSALTEEECAHLFRIVNQMKAQGTSFIYITHKMDEIFVISDEVTIMRDGQYVDTKLSSEVTKNDLVRMMVGRELTNVYPKREVAKGDVLLEVSNLTCPGVINDVSFTVRRGEILGVAGLMGAGRSETMETLFGLRHKSAGIIRIDGKEVSINRPQDAIRNKIAFLTEDRRGKGCFLGLPMYDNTLQLVWKRTRTPFGLSKKKGKKLVQGQIDRFSIRSAGQKQPVGELSGGNQQKVLLARSMLSQPEIFIMDEPTKGIDVGTKYEIYLDMIRLAEEGKAIIMISSEMPEILGMSDRILIMHEGSVAGIFDREEATQEIILNYAAGLSGDMAV